MKLPRQILPILDTMARGMAAGNRHVTVPHGALRSVAPLEAREPMVEYLARQVEHLTQDRPNGQLTVRMADSRLFYGYLQGGMFDMAACPVSAPAGVLDDPQLVVQGWVISNWGLFPLEFDRMPADAHRR